MNKLILFFFVAAMGLSRSAGAAYPDWMSFGHTGVVNVVCRQNNILWVGTTGGLVRYDEMSGKREVFNKANSGLPSNAIESIQVDADGDIWIGTYDAGVAVYNGSDFIIYNMANSKLPGNVVRSIFIGKNNTKYIGTQKGIVEINGDNVSVMQNFSMDVWSMNMDNSGALWIGCSFGVWKMENSTLTNFTDSVPLYGVSDIAYDSAKNLMVFAGIGTGLVTWDGNHWKTLTFDDPSIGSAVKVAFDKNHLLWAATTYSGVVCFTSPQQTIYDTADNIPVTGRAMFSDNTGTIYFGTSNGLYSFDGTSWTPGNAIQSDFKNESVSRIVSDKKGTIWFANGNYLGSFDGSNWKYYSLPKYKYHPATVNSIRIDATGKIWVASSRGLYTLAGENLKLVEGLVDPGQTMYDVAIAKDGKIFVAGDSGLNVFNGSEWRLETPKLALSVALVRLAVDNTERLWVGTNRDQMLSFANGEWKSYSYADGNFAGGYVNDIIIDHKGKIWASTWGGGINSFDGNKWVTESHYGEVIQALDEDANGNIWAVDYINHRLFNTSDPSDTFGIYNSPIVQNFLNGIAIDEKGNIWIADANGILKYTGNSNSTRIPSNPVSTSVSIFPNPSQGLLEISIPEWQTDARVSVYSIQGRLIETSALKNKLNSLDISNVSAGIYIIKITGANLNFQSRISISK
jgi:ligand-binding sensor domain-containing protein